MKASLSTRVIEILITKQSTEFTHPQSWWEVNFFWNLHQPGISSFQCYSGSTFPSLWAPKYFPWIIFSPNHNSFQLLISARSSRCLDSSSHMLLWLLGADISAASTFLDEVSLYMANSISFGFCLYIIYKYCLAQEAPGTASFTWPIGCLWMHCSWASSNSLVTSLEMFPWNAASGLNDSPRGWEFTAVN